MTDKVKKLKQSLYGSDWKPEDDVIREYNHDYVDINACANTDIDYSDSLFDPNEKDPVMRALNMVKEYCRVSVDQLTDYDFSISEFNHKREAYKDVINFIEDHQRKCKAVEQSELQPQENFTLKHFQNERDWFEKRMKDYRGSFFKVCDIVEHSDCAGIIKKLIDEERKKY